MHAIPPVYLQYACHTSMHACLLLFCAACRLNGQALVFSNATYTGDPPSAWNPASCVEHGVRHSSLLTKRPRRGAAVQGGPFQPDVPIAAVATSPDSESFAHFTDRVVNVWAQALLVLGSLRAAGLLGNGTSAPGAAPPRSTGVDVITGRASRNQIVQQLVSALGMGRTLYDNPIRASVMIFTCRVPLIHPYIFLKFAELLGVQQNIPMEQRKAVVYMPRSDSTANGRLLLNQDALLRAIEDMLQKRNQSERLVLFSASKYPTLGELITFFRQARAIVAPDGAAMYNARFAPRDTLVLETMPSERMAVMFHEQSHLIGQPYVVHVSKSLNGSRHDMEVDVSAVVGALERNLGITGIKTVLPYYPWVFDT